MFAFSKIILEGIRVAFNALWSNRLRTSLSLLGVAIGIFSMISVLSIIGSMEDTIRQSFSRLGSDTVFVMRESWSEDPAMNWWKYVRRPYPSYEEFEQLEKRLSSVEEITLRILFLDQQFRQREQSVEGVNIAAGTHDFGSLFDFEIDKGRYLSEQESTTGANRVILGATVAENLFPGNPYPIGKSIKWRGKKLIVTAVLKKEGSSLLGDGFDNLAFLPLNFVRKFERIDSKERMPLIAARPKASIGLSQMEDEMRGVLRSFRNLRPSEEDNFEFNRLSILDGIMDVVFLVVRLAGLFIGALAMLVGAFGIANIMFVSVKERTRLIGIKKAMGAHNYHILLEFLVESIVLTLGGGLVGLLTVALGITIFNWYFETFEAYMSLTNVMFGLGISVFVGILAGIVPAVLAARLDPVEAMRK